MLNKMLSLPLAMLLLANVSCKKSDNPGPSTCDPSHRPLVLVHGFLASGDTYATQTQRFSSNGYCTERIFTLDWNTLQMGANHDAELDALIDSVLSITGASQVDLAGHSAGSGLCYSYLNDATHASKVAHYVHLAGNAPAGPAGPGGSVPTLNIWSPADSIVAGGNMPTGQNLQLEGADHYQVATGTETFSAMYAFYNDGKLPTTTDILPEGSIQVSGKALTLGDNVPATNAVVQIWLLDRSTGERASATPNYQIRTNSTTGAWGPVSVAPGFPYEFRVVPAGAGERPVIYYREGFTRSNPLVYLRTIPTTGLGAFLLGGLPNDDNQSVIALFTASQATIHGRDQLFINNTELSTAQYADAGRTAIAWFCYDDGDQNTELTPVGLFGNFPFLNGVDFFTPTVEPTTVPLQFNGRNLLVRNRKSASEGIVVAVFD